MDNQHSAEKAHQALIDSQPKRADFKSQDEFEEALGYWQGHQGRILGMRRLQDSPRPSPSTDD